MKWYDVHELLTAALPRVPIVREQPFRFEWRSILHDPTVIAHEGARLFADPSNRVDLRDIARTTAPWFMRDVRRDERTADIVPCDGDEWFRDACGRVNDWLSKPCDYLHRDEVAAHLGPYAAVECARQCSPAVRALLLLPKVAPVVETFERGEPVDEDAWRAACDAVKSVGDANWRMFSEGKVTLDIAFGAVISMIHRHPDFNYICSYLQGRESLAEWSAFYAAEKREKPPA